MQQRALSCWQCGTVLSVAGGRCPACGAEQLAPEARRAGRPRESSESDGEATRSSSPLLWVALVVGLGVIGAGAVLLRPRGAGSEAAAHSPLAAAAASETSGSSASDLGAVDLKSVDPMEALGRAKSRALAWSKDAVLVSMRVRPVESGRVNVQAGGSVEYWFGKPTGEGFGPGTRIGGKRLHVSLESTGVKTQETQGSTGRAALEPNCPLDAAAHAAVAAGIAPPLLAIYEVTERLAQKPVWRVSTDGQDAAQRFIDGMSCAVLVR